MASNNNIIIRYDFMFSLIENQLDNKDTDIIIVVSNMKYIDIPSIPRFSWYELIKYDCWTNWNWLLKNSNQINTTKETIKFNMEINNAIVLSCLLLFNTFVVVFCKLADKAQIPNKGIKTREVKIRMYFNHNLPLMCIHNLYTI